MRLKMAVSLSFLMAAACVGSPESDGAAVTTIAPSTSSTARMSRPTSTTTSTLGESEVSPGDVAECPMSESDVIDRGEELFSTFTQTTPGCAFCHDVDAAPLFARFGEETRNSGPALVGVMDRHSEEFVRAQILEGGGLMPGRGNYVEHESIDVLGCTELDQLIAYLYSLGSGEVLMTDALLEYESSQAEMGAVVFAEHCETCHRDGGRSEGAGHAFSPQPPELSHVFKMHSRAMVVQMITSGKGNMPAYREQLSNEDVNALIAYLTRLAEE